MRRSSRRELNNKVKITKCLLYTAGPVCLVTFFYDRKNGHVLVFLCIGSGAQLSHCSSPLPPNCGNPSQWPTKVDHILERNFPIYILRSESYSNTNRSKQTLWTKHKRRKKTTILVCEFYLSIYDAVFIDYTQTATE